MGNDGGSIPKRRELVNEAARQPSVAQLKETAAATLEHAWTTDPVSLLPLTAPIVSDAHGTLYNKDSIIEFLLEGKRDVEFQRATRGAVKSLKDVVEVKFTRAGEEETARGVPQYVCPITSEPLGAGSKAKAVYIVPCGHAFSASVVKEILGGSGDRRQGDGEANGGDRDDSAAPVKHACLTCDTSYASNDIIPVLPTDPLEIARLALRRKKLAELGLSHSLKKLGKTKSKEKKDRQDDKTERKKRKAGDDEDVGTQGMNINDASTASLTARVLEEGKAKKLKAAAGQSENVKSLFSSQTKHPGGNNSDFMTRGFSVR